MLNNNYAPLIPAAGVASTAAGLVAEGYPDLLVTLPNGVDFPGSQDDDGVRAVAAIDVLRTLVAEYEETEADNERYEQARRTDSNHLTDVTCDGCDATDEAGWGDTALCLNCEDAANICGVHLRTFVGSCPLPLHDECEDFCGLHVDHDGPCRTR